MAFKIIKPNEIPSDSPLTCMIYGEPGAGKTSVALTAETPLLLDLERGITRVNNCMRGDSVQVTHFGELLEVIKSKEIEQYKTIIVDPIDQVVELAIAYLGAKDKNIYKVDGTPKPNAWGAIGQLCRKFFRDLRQLGKGVVLTAHCSVERIGENEFVRPKLTKSVRESVIKDLDLVGYMRELEGRRVIYFSGTDISWGKNCACLKDPCVVPDFETHASETMEFLSKQIFGRVKTYREQNAELKVVYDSLVAEYDKEISRCCDLQSVKDTCNKLKCDNRVVWDSQRLWRIKLQDKAKTLGIEFDKKQGDWVCIQKNGNAGATSKTDKTSSLSGKPAEQETDKK